jgi:hypothetical protein
LDGQVKVEKAPVTRLRITGASIAERGIADPE